MKNKAQTPHDTYMRKTFETIAIAKDFFKNALPASIVSAMNLDTLTPTEKTFIDDSLRHEITDILFKVDINGIAGYAYVLVEHMSTQNKWLSYRMLKYVMSVIKYHLEINPKAKCLPVVIPCILHTGKRKFNHSLDIMDLFGTQKALAQQVMFKPPHLVDLPAESDQQLLRFQLFRVAAMLAKHVRDPDIVPTLKFVGELMNYLWENEFDGYVNISLQYLWQAGQTNDKAVFRETLKTVLPEMKEADIMNIAEMFKEDVKAWGVKQGKELGRKEGLEQGKKEEKIEMIKNMISSNIPIKTISEVSGWSEKDIKKLIH